MVISTRLTTYENAKSMGFHLFNNEICGETIGAKVELPKSRKDKRKHDGRKKGIMKQVMTKKKKVATVYTATTTKINTTPAPHKTYTTKHPMCNRCKLLD